MLLTVDSHFCSMLCCSLWTMFRYGSLPRPYTMCCLASWCKAASSTSPKLYGTTSRLQSLGLQPLYSGDDAVNRMCRCRKTMALSFLQLAAIPVTFDKLERDCMCRFGKGVTGTSALKLQEAKVPYMLSHTATHVWLTTFHTVYTRHFDGAFVIKYFHICHIFASTVFCVFSMLFSRINHSLVNQESMRRLYSFIAFCFACKFQHITRRTAMAFKLT